MSKEERNTLKIALVGNPNTGKSSLFNQLTGLNQKTGNYPGITVDKKVGIFHHDGRKIELTDLPGTYSINPNSKDESVVLNTLLNPKSSSYPDLVIVVAEVENLKRNLFLYSQIRDLGFPCLLAINMVDQMERKGIQIDKAYFEQHIQVDTFWISARKGLGLDQLKDGMLKDIKPTNSEFEPILKRIDIGLSQRFLERSMELKLNLYQAWVLRTQKDFIEIPELRKNIVTLEDEFAEDFKGYQRKETILRYKEINDFLKQCYQINFEEGKGLTARLDQVLTHKFWGYFIFLAILFLIFQSVFDLASYPMDAIDEFFLSIQSNLGESLPPGPLSDMVTEGLIPGLGGIVIFIPQIAILFFFLSILEESGYMSRVVFLMDKVMRKFGMSGKSVISLVSGTACAIPAIMASRNINDWKERLITILVTPLTTCSARLPVYAIIIALVVPDTKVLGFISLQGITLFSLYIFGFLMAVIGAKILSRGLKIPSKNFFIIEMPSFRLPAWKNVFNEVFEKTKSFVLGAGKIILALSVILWFLASHGSSDFQNAEVNIQKEYAENDLSEEELSELIASYKLENSYIGQMGKVIEPVIQPLGYDWKIGIAILSSFAAREVFVSTISTIYSVGSEEELSIRARMEQELRPDGSKRYNLATGMSLLMFYAIAMQCIGTLAVVKKETKSWKWPMLQFVVLGAMAYVLALITYNIFL